MKQVFAVLLVVFAFALPAQAIGGTTKNATTLDTVASVHIRTQAVFADTGTVGIISSGTITATNQVTTGIISSVTSTGGTATITGTTTTGHLITTTGIVADSIGGARVSVDTLRAAKGLFTPGYGTKPTCNSTTARLLAYDTGDGKLYICNGTTWKPVAYDGDGDGLSDLIDANDALAFTAGTAVAANVLTGTTFYTGASMTETSGSMANNGAWTTNPASSNVTIPIGYHSGSGYVNGDADFVVANIKGGADLWGTIGTYPSAGNLLPGDDAAPNAVASQVLVGKEVWDSDGTNIAGSMANNGNWNTNPSTSNVTIPVGFHVGAGVVYGDADFVAANLKTSANLWGVVGTYPSSGNRLSGDDGTANAAAAQVLTSYETWDSDGANIVGTMANQGAWTSNPSAGGVSIPTGYHAGGSINADGNFTAGNIRSGVTIWGVGGTSVAVVSSTTYTGGGLEYSGNKLDAYSGQWLARKFCREKGYDGMSANGMDGYYAGGYYNYSSSNPGDGDYSKSTGTGASAVYNSITCSNTYSGGGY